LLASQFSTLLLRFLLGVDCDVDDVGAIDTAAATVAEDDVAADPSAAGMSESRVSVRLDEETLVEGLELGAKLESESSSIFSSSTSVRT
jgi:hypothetical protein